MRTTTRTGAAILTTALVAAALTACGSSTGSPGGSGGSPSGAGQSRVSQTATPAAGGKIQACRLVPRAMLEKALGARVGAGRRKTTPAPDLDACSYQPSPTSYVLVQATGRADTFFPASMYPTKGEETVAVPGADRGYATPVSNAGPLDASQVFVVKHGRAVQVTVSVPGRYTTDDMVALGRSILAEL